MSRATVLSQAIIDNLNDTTFSMRFQAVRAYTVAWKLKEIKSLRVAVVAPAITQTRMSRHATLDTISVDVVLVKQVKMHNNDEADAMSNLAEEVGDYLVNSMFGGAQCKSVNIASPYDMDDIVQYQVFTAVIRCEYDVAWRRA